MEQDYKGTERRKNNGEHICVKEEAIDSIYDDMNNVKSDINTIKNDKIHTNELLSGITKQLSSIDKRLFIDNGTLSIQTQLRDGGARMAQIEINLRAMDAQVTLNNKTMADKIDDVKKEPKKYAVYTVGLISLLGGLCGLIIWINAHSFTPTPQYIYQPVPIGQSPQSQIPALTKTEK
jgi:hypothetical protein